MCCDSWGHKELDTTERLNCSWNWESQTEAETLTGCQVQMPILQMGKLSSASPDLRFLKAGP